ncbi:MAG: hypothetical protein PHX38_02250 [Sulfuricella sp.]|nr:hypothetical protein [Sulfuricella sp.]
MRFLTAFLFAALLAGCAAYSGSGLKPGEARLDDVLKTMGQPAMRWQDPAGSVQLSYPRGPMGDHSYMAYIGPDGKLQRIENVLDAKHFARIKPGMTEGEVARILGPAEPAWTVYFKARDELVWEWRYCDEWNELARFNVLFDGGKLMVRSTMSLTEAQRGLCGGDGSCWCGH